MKLINPFRTRKLLIVSTYDTKHIEIPFFGKMRVDSIPNEEFIRTSTYEVVIIDEVIRRNNRVKSNSNERGQTK